MLAAPKVEPQPSESLTWDEIKLRYPDQWVCLADFVSADPTNEHCVAFAAARVVATAASRRDIHASEAALRTATSGPP